MPTLPAPVLRTLGRFPALSAVGRPNVGYQAAALNPVATFVG
jgi:hypothetical protein